MKYGKYRTTNVVHLMVPGSQLSNHLIEKISHRHISYKSDHFNILLHNIAHINIQL